MIVVVSSHSALHLFDDHNDSKISKRSSQTEVKEPLGGGFGLRTKLLEWNAVFMRIKKQLPRVIEIIYSISKFISQHLLPPYYV